MFENAPAAQDTVEQKWEPSFSYLGSKVSILGWLSLLDYVGKKLWCRNRELGRVQENSVLACAGQQALGKVVKVLG